MNLSSHKNTENAFYFLDVATPQDTLQKGHQIYDPFW